ncbi:thioredoxin family protein [Oscillospiraceae bacterium CM]|nr:thioredoxin family protein [Oscillospiraceae bacterium CM]
MKDILMFMTTWCPYCKRASVMIEQLKAADERYKDLEIIMIDEEKEKKYADSFNYFRVPTFYVDGEKIHEGAANLDIIRTVFDKALE